MTNKPSDKPTPEEMAFDTWHAHLIRAGEVPSGIGLKEYMRTAWRTAHAEGLKAGQGELEAVKSGKGIANPYIVKDAKIKSLEKELTQAKARIQDACRDYMKEREAALGLVEAVDKWKRLAKMWHDNIGMPDDDAVPLAWDEVDKQLAAYKARNGDCTCDEINARHCPIHNDPPVATNPSDSECATSRDEE